MFVRLRLLRFARNDNSTGFVFERGCLLGEVLRLLNVAGCGFLRLIVILGIGGCM